MAKAELTCTEEVVTTTVPAIQLTLTLEEAAALRCTCQKISGSAKTSIRGVMDDISLALVEAGVFSQPTSGEVCTSLGTIGYKEDSRSRLRY
ncbi:MAG: hypothetical protein PVI03_05540 [Candidatus Thorarchaeota archaeon]|jgi:hypothetical protein